MHSLHFSRAFETALKRRKDAFQLQHMEPIDPATLARMIKAARREASACAQTDHARRSSAYDYTTGSLILWRI